MERECQDIIKVNGYSAIFPAILTKENRGWSGGAMVLGKLPVPGRPTNLGPTALAVGAGGGCLDIFLSSIISLFFPPLSGRRPDID